MLKCCSLSNKKDMCTCVDVCCSALRCQSTGEETVRVVGRGSMSQGRAEPERGPIQRQR